MVLKGAWGAGESPTSWACRIEGRIEGRYNLSPTEIKISYVFNLWKFPRDGFAGTTYVQAMVEECDVDIRRGGLGGWRSATWDKPGSGH